MSGVVVGVRGGYFFIRRMGRYGPPGWKGGQPKGQGEGGGVAAKPHVGGLFYGRAAGLGHAALSGVVVGVRGGTDNVGAFGLNRRYALVPISPKSMRGPRHAWGFTWPRGLERGGGGGLWWIL